MKTKEVLEWGYLIATILSFPVGFALLLLSIPNDNILGLPKEGNTFFGQAGLILIMGSMILFFIVEKYKKE